MTTTDRIDLFSPDTYAQAMPHDDFARLRRDAPVSWQEEPEGRGYWALTKYDDVVRVSTDSSLFSSAVGGTNIPDMPADAMSMIRTRTVPGRRVRVTSRTIGHQAVAGAAHRLDHRHPVGRAELATQPRDVDLDDVGVAGEVGLPYPVEDLGL